jgi:hypothetical protein
MLRADIRSRLRRLPYGDAALHWVLGALGLLIFVSEPLRSAGIIGGWFQTILLASILLIGLLGLSAPTRLIWLVVALTPVVVAALILTTTDSPPAWRMTSDLVTALALALLAAALLRQVFAGGRVTMARIEGALAFYLLAAVVFALIYGAVEVASPGAFSLGAGSGPVGLLDRRLLYFSLVTQTSTGFGDVTAVHDIARSLVTLQAVGGQFFTAVLLARLVSLEIMDRSAGGS